MMVLVVEGSSDHSGSKSLLFATVLLGAGGAWSHVRGVKHRSSTHILAHHPCIYFLRAKGEIRCCSPLCRAGRATKCSCQSSPRKLQLVLREQRPARDGPSSPNNRPQQRGITSAFLDASKARLKGCWNIHHVSENSKQMCGSADN